MCSSDLTPNPKPQTPNPTDIYKEPMHKQDTFSSVSLSNKLEEGKATPTTSPALLWSQVDGLEIELMAIDCEIINRRNVLLKAKSDYDSLQTRAKDVESRLLSGINKIEAFESMISGREIAAQKADLIIQAKKVIKKATDECRISELDSVSLNTTVASKVRNEFKFMAENNKKYLEAMKVEEDLIQARLKMRTKKVATNQERLTTYQSQLKFLDDTLKEREKEVEWLCSLSQSKASGRGTHSYKLRSNKLITKERELAARVNEFQKDNDIHTVSSGTEKSVRDSNKERILSNPSLTRL